MRKNKFFFYFFVAKDKNMYLDFKVCVWKRYKVPDHLKEDCHFKLIEGQIKSIDDFINYYKHNGIEIKEIKEDHYFLNPDENDGEATIQLYDINGNLIFSNDNDK